MQIKKFRGADMQEALQHVKRELGQDAIILSTRQVRGGGGTFGLFGKPMLEVTAARDAEENGGDAAGLLASLPNAFAKGRRVRGAGTESDLVKQILARNQIDTQSLLAPLQDEIQELKELLHHAGDVQRESVRESVSLSQIQSEISEMRQTLQSLSAQSAGLREAEYAENLVVLFQQLIFNGMEEKFARRLIEESMKNIPVGEMEDFAYVKIFLARMLMKILKVTGGIRTEPNRQTIAALIGPTGVGKTTTVAKLASEQMLKFRRKVGLITVDTFRIAAVEQLKVYAKIMGVPITVVGSKQELRRAIQEFAECDAIFVDTGGRSQRDGLQMSEIYRMFGGDDPIDVYLTMSVTTKDSDQSEITRRFGQIPLAGVMYTKLDESTTFGSMFNHSIRFKTPVAYLTTGQKVPEDIEVATKERLVDLLLNIVGN
ncbi:MAG: flagellar biosynthesis protein FlhF [SAR324 cluster bacterium]|nr:flagellar biosynthesis protein FlhF [SAR324 cluster bacterium]